MDEEDGIKYWYSDVMTISGQMCVKGTINPRFPLCLEEIGFSDGAMQTYGGTYTLVVITFHTVCLLGIRQCLKTYT